MTALEVQHGGGHYKTLKTQPVEFWQSNQMGASEGCVIRYVTRWRTKDGLQDLKKAKHFIEFILEDEDYMWQLREIRSALFPAFWTSQGQTAEEYISGNAIGNLEAGVIRHMYYWNVRGAKCELRSAMKWMDELIATAVEEGWKDEPQGKARINELECAIDSTCKALPECGCDRELITIWVDRLRRVLRK